VVVATGADKNNRQKDQLETNFDQLVQRYALMYEAATFFP
jgi:hypothetical protein